MTIYVDYETGDDSKGDGSRAFPYKTLNKAMEKVEDGDGVFVREFWDLDYAALRETHRKEMK